MKAVVCFGSARPFVADPAAVRVIAAEYAAAVPGDKLSAWQQGWPGFGVWAGEPGYAPVAQFTDTTRGEGCRTRTRRCLCSVCGCPGRAGRWTRGEPPS